jgi:hypothetical protein
MNEMNHSAGWASCSCKSHVCGVQDRDEAGEPLSRPLGLGSRSFIGPIHVVDDQYEE